MEFKTDLKNFEFVSEDLGLVTNNDNVLTIDPNYDQFFNITPPTHEPPVYRTFLNSISFDGDEIPSQYLEDYKIEMTKELGLQMYLNGFFETIIEDNNNEYTFNRKRIIMKAKIEQI
jgi:hypothetical protein